VHKARAREEKPTGGETGVSLMDGITGDNNFTLTSALFTEDSGGFSGVIDIELFGSVDFGIFSWGVKGFESFSGVEVEEVTIEGWMGRELAGVRAIEG
jgi:hypothetical protein